MGVNNVSKVRKTNSTGEIAQNIFHNNLFVSFSHSRAKSKHQRPSEIEHFNENLFQTCKLQKL